MNRSWFLVLSAFLAWAGVACSRKAPPLSAPPESAAPQPLDPEIETLAIATGKAVAGQAFSLLSSNLLRAIQEVGIGDALPYCSAQAIPLTQIVARTNNVSLRRVTHQARNPANQANATELALLQRLREEQRTGKPLKPIATVTAPDTVTVYAPIVISTNLCLKCHGAPETDVALEHWALIKRLYPGDTAIGFKLGDVRGLWRIDLRRSALSGTP